MGLVLDNRVQHFVASALFEPEGSQSLNGLSAFGLNIGDEVVEFSRAKRKMNFYVYILECADKSLYVGCTNNLQKRIKQHNESKWGAYYTKMRRPVRLIYSEEFLSLILAHRRESEIKGWRREKKLALVLNKLKD